MKCTVIIATYDHQDLLNFSIQSVIDQTIQDFEIFIVGDGAPKRTDEIMAHWCSSDPRIKYFTYPKGLGHGEIYRHHAIRNSTGKYIFYLGDDDMWMPDHIQTILPYLSVFDFVHTCHTSIDPNGVFSFLEYQLNDPWVQKKMCSEQWNFFGPTCVAHTREAYDKLPYGWRPRPDGIWSDLYMWRQWLDSDKFKFFSIPITSTLHFPSTLRQHMSLKDRVQELTIYSQRIKESKYVDHIQSLFKNRKHNEPGLHQSYIDGLLLTIKTVQTEKSILQKIFISQNQQIKIIKVELQKWKKEYKNLKKAWSTRLGFLITFPFRKIWEYLNSKPNN